jgi:hypothetical protein
MLRNQNFLIKVNIELICFNNHIFLRLFCNSFLLMLNFIFYIDFGYIKTTKVVLKGVTLIFLQMKRNLLFFNQMHFKIKKPYFIFLHFPT